MVVEERAIDFPESVVEQESWVGQRVGAHVVCRILLLDVSEQAGGVNVKVALEERGGAGVEREEVEEFVAVGDQQPSAGSDDSLGGVPECGVFAFGEIGEDVERREPVASANCGWVGSWGRWRSSDFGQFAPLCGAN